MVSIVTLIKINLNSQIKFALKNVNDSNTSGSR